MRYAVLALVAAALTGCASAPVQPLTSCAAPSAGTASEGYRLIGTVNSMMSAGKISVAAGTVLNRNLRTAEADLRSGKTAEANNLIDSVKLAIASAAKP